jgi:cytoskeletal protein CcmA (bactofilin family)
MAQGRFGSAPTSASGTVIGSGLTIEGEISGSEAVTIEGQVRGTITLSAALTVAAGGKVEANVEASVVDVQGELAGNVAAGERVAVGPEGRLVGDVRSPRISIADGAVFKGHIDMDA